MYYRSTFHINIMSIEEKFNKSVEDVNTLTDLNNDILIWII
jgi:hypothetical protein